MSDTDQNPPPAAPQVATAASHNLSWIAMAVMAIMGMATLAWAASLTAG